MANVLYPKGKAHLLGGATAVNLVSDTIKAMVVHSATTPYNSSHEFVSDLVAGGIVARAAAGLATKTVTSGTFDADDLVLASVVGATIDAIVVYKDSGADATSTLLGWMDVTPYSPTGGNITLVWSGSGLFAI